MHNTQLILVYEMSQNSPNHQTTPELQAYLVVLVSD